MESQPTRRAFSWVAWGLRLVWSALVLAVVLTGVWVASSWAAYQGGSVGWVCLAGLLAFPLLPLTWDVVARRRKRGRPAILTLWDRLVLRTLALNLAFVGILLWVSPSTAFTALSARGDWFLDEVEPSTADVLRPWVLGTADTMAWLYESDHRNVYREIAKREDAEPHPAPAPSNQRFEPEHERPESTPPPEDPSTPPENADDPTPSPEDATAPVASRPWPSARQVHDVIERMPASARRDIGSVGRYIDENADDPFERVKAIHDFVATHLAYDAAAYYAGDIPSQDAAVVFRTKKAVCAGYAHLTKAIADVTGDELVVVVGDARTRGSDVAGEGHAWNAAYIEGQWYLLDATWDAGHLSGSRFVADFDTSYLFTPPEIMVLTHFPDDPRWQLLEDPLGRGEFNRQPMLRPSFFAQGFELLSPRRSQVSVTDRVELSLGNENEHFLMAKSRVPGGSELSDCAVNHGDSSTRVQCTFDRPGRYEIILMSSPTRYGTYHQVGELEVNATG